MEALPGVDTRTRVTIIDDDKPGQIGFKEKNSVKVSAAKSQCEIAIVRNNGSDGVVKVNYNTVSLGNGSHFAVDGRDYRST